MPEAYAQTGMQHAPGGNGCAAPCHQVNTYPGYRSFKAIGVGGDGFVRAMVSAVESVVATPVHEECVQERPSSKGSYISVTVGPVLLHNREQASLCTTSISSTSPYNAMAYDRKSSMQGIVLQSLQ